MKTKIPIILWGSTSFSFPIPNRLVKRDNLLSLLNKSSLLTVLVAPFGYGKTTFAYQVSLESSYAKRTLWFDCSELNFLLSLEKGTIDVAAVCKDSKPTNVVFDDFNEFSTEKVFKFKELVAKFLALGIKVLITTQYFIVSKLFSSGTIIPAKKLLLETTADSLSDESAPDTDLVQIHSQRKKDVAQKQGIKNGKSIRQDRGTRQGYAKNIFEKRYGSQNNSLDLIEQRIPLINFGFFKQRKLFIEKLNSAQIVAEYDFIEKLILLLEKGSFDELQNFFDTDITSSLGHLEAFCPHCGIDMQLKSFIAMRTSAEEKNQFFLILLKNHSRFCSSRYMATFANDVMDILIDQDKEALACRLMILSGDMYARQRFLETHCLALFHKGHIEYLAELAQYVQKEALSAKVLQIILSVYAILNDVSGFSSCESALFSISENQSSSTLINALKDFRDEEIYEKTGKKTGKEICNEENHQKSAVKQAVSFDDVNTQLNNYLIDKLYAGAYSSLTMMRFNYRMSFRKRISFIETMNLLLSVVGTKTEVTNNELLNLFSDEETHYKALCLFGYSCLTKPQKAHETLEFICASSLHMYVVLNCVSLFLAIGFSLMDDALHSDKAYLQLTNQDGLDFLSNPSAASVNVSANTYTNSFIKDDQRFQNLLKAVISTETRMLPPNVFEGFINQFIRHLLNNRQLSCFPGLFFSRAKEMQDYVSGQKRDWIKKFGNELAYLGLEKTAEVPTDQIPCLYLRVLGGFNGEVVAGGRRYPVTVRRKGQIFLAILAANFGGQISRLRIENALWPETVHQKARQSFYTLSNSVKQALDKYSEGYKFFEARYNSVYLLDSFVKTDLQALERIHAKLLSKNLMTTDYEDLLLEMQSVYRGPLLPGVVNTELEAYRVSYSNKTIEALLKASKKLLHGDEHELALRYAQFAFDTDPGREDVCYELMKIQYSLGQNNAAIQTFRRCCNYLIENQGMSASRRLRDLNNRIFEEMQ